jgi:hypothetical protein
MSTRRRAGGARKMKAFSRVETLATATAFDRALRRKDQLVLVEFVSVRPTRASRPREAKRGRRRRETVARTRPRTRGKRGEDRGPRTEDRGPRTRGLTRTRGSPDARVRRTELQPFE